MGKVGSITYATATVLLSVREGHAYGFDIMDVTGLPDGTVYPALRRLEDRGLLTAHWEKVRVARDEGRPPRRYYRLTKAGLRALNEALARFPVLARLFSGTDADPDAVLAEQ